MSVIGRLISSLPVAAIAVMTAMPSWALPLSSGDQIRVLIPEGEEFSGTYKLDIEGEINIPYLDPLPVRGLEPEIVELLLTRMLVEEGFFQPEFLQVSVLVLERAPVPITVSGAVFEPGRILINNRSPEELASQQNLVSGDNPQGRYLTAALQAVGGIRPDAKLDEIRVIRGQRVEIFDLSGVFSGESVEDIPLISGDRVEVPTVGYFQDELARPSQITPPGIRIFLSNLTIPANSNANSAIGRDATRFPYGSRLSQAVVAANCAGGTQATNADRKVLLVGTDRLTGLTRAVERDIETLLEQPGDSKENPLLMPGDAVACYDSTVTNARDVSRTITDILSPFSIIIDWIF